jgi:hypothetical protein
MISRRIQQKQDNDNYGRLAKYIADANHAGEKCMHAWCAGCWAGDDYSLAIQEVSDTQDLNTRTVKEKTYHLIVSFRPEDEFKLNLELLKKIELEFARALGFEEHQRHCGVHKNTNNLHMHIAYNMIHPEKLTRHEPFRDYYLRDNVCRSLELKYGLRIDNGRSTEATSKIKLNPIAATVEAHCGQESFDRYVKERKSEILLSMQNAGDWSQVHAAFARFGLEIKPYGNGLVIKDMNGKLAIKASSLDRSLAHSKMVQKFGEYEAINSCCMHVQQEQFCNRPLHKDPNRDNLYNSYMTEMAERRSALNELSQNKNLELNAARLRWEEERKKIIQEFTGNHRYRLLKISRLREAEHRINITKAFGVKIDNVRSERPFVSWIDFLRWKASQGNDQALAVLRSKNHVVNSEVKSEKYFIKNSKNSIRKESINAQIAILSDGTIDPKKRRSLLAIAKICELAEVESLTQDKNKFFTGFSTRIDSEGTLFIHLSNGDVIRDAGTKIIYSSNSSFSHNAAEIYAKSKFGPNISKGHNSFEFKKEVVIEQSNEYFR